MAVSGAATGAHPRLEAVGKRATARREGVYLAVFAALFTVAAVAPYLQEVHAWPRIPCVFNRLTGLPCFACGLTRSICLSARGDFLAAFHMHLLGPLLFFAGVALIAYFVYALVSGRRFTTGLGTSGTKSALVILLVLFAAAWAAKLLFLSAYW